MANVTACTFLGNCMCRKCLADRGQAAAITPVRSPRCVWENPTGRAGIVNSSGEGGHGRDRKGAECGFG